MNLTEIKDIYNKLGIRSDQERQKFIDMSNISNDRNEYYFIQNSPISSFSEKNEVINNA